MILQQERITLQYGVTSDFNNIGGTQVLQLSMLLMLEVFQIDQILVTMQQV